MHIPLDIPLPIVLDCSFSVSEGIRFIRTDGSPLWVMNNSLHYEEEDKHTVAIIYIFHSNMIVVEVPLYWSELANKFGKVPNHHICVAVTGKRVNGGIGLGL